MGRFNLLGEFINKVGLRKLLLTFYWLSLISFLLYSDKLDTKTYADITFWLVIGVFGANSFEHFTKTKGDKKEPEVLESSREGSQKDEKEKL